MRRHFDGASNFAPKYFGAIKGQREGRQGQSYAIPTIGGIIGLKDIRESVKAFAQYAIEHSEWHFLVAPVGCGGGSHPSTFYEELMMEYKYGDKNYYWRVLSDSPFILSFKRKDSLQTYLVNCDTEQVVEMIDSNGIIKIFSHDDIDFAAIDSIYVEQVFLLSAPYGICVWGFDSDGISLVRWGVGGQDKLGCPVAYIDGYIDTDFRVVIPFKPIDDPFHEGNYRLAICNKQQLSGKKSIWR